MEEKNQEGRGSLVLVVEDDRFLSQVLSDRLTQEGYRVTLCKNGEEGIEQARSSKHDLVLLDVILPGLDGLSVLEQIKENNYLDTKRVIVLSNLSDPERVQQAKDLGADYYVKSETELAKLMGSINEKISDREGEPEVE